MRARLSARATLRLAVLATLLAACSGGPDSGASTAEPAGRTTAGSSTHGEDDTPRYDLTDPGPVEWTSSDVVSTRTLRVHFVTGDAGCFGAHALVDETSDEVSVTIVVGVVPEAPDACPAVGRDAALLVELAAPLGDRRVTDPTAAGTR